MTPTSSKTSTLPIKLLNKLMPRQQRMNLGIDRSALPEARTRPASNLKTRPIFSNDKRQSNQILSPAMRYDAMRSSATEWAKFPERLETHIDYVDVFSNECISIPSCPMHGDSIKHHRYARNLDNELTQNHSLMPFITHHSYISLCNRSAPAPFKLSIISFSDTALTICRSSGFLPIRDGVLVGVRKLVVRPLDS